VNKIFLCGHLTRGVELQYLPSGAQVGKTAIAVTHKYKKQDGSAGEEVMFIDLTFFGKRAETANQYLKKGSKVLLEGRLKLDTWQDQSGHNKSKHSVMIESFFMLDSKDNSQPNQSKPANQRQNKPPKTDDDYYEGEEIPF
jgi:single-strand DNA-binding protein